jgi:hypothetical protein
LIDMLLFGMPVEPVKSVSCSGGKFVLEDNSETPDTQVALYEFETYTMIWEHKVGTGVGINGRPWGMMWTGSEGTLILNDSGYEILPEPKKKSLERGEFKGSGDARPAHVRNFLDCVKSREKPVMDAELGHHVSTVAHLGNLALRSGAKIAWDAGQERVVNDRKADQLVGVKYRRPWTLPYSKRA